MQLYLGECSRVSLLTQFVAIAHHDFSPTTKEVLRALRIETPYFFIKSALHGCYILRPITGQPLGKKTEHPEDADYMGTGWQLALCNTRLATIMFTASLVAMQLLVGGDKWWEPEKH